MTSRTSDFFSILFGSPTFGISSDMKHSRYLPYVGGLGAGGNMMIYFTIWFDDLVVLAV